MPKSYKLINLLNQIIEADLTWTGNRFESGVQLHINSYGQIAKIASDLTLNPIRLKDQVLLPGFINVHSHIFQRELRLGNFPIKLTNIFINKIS